MTPGEIESGAYVERGGSMKPIKLYTTAGCPYSEAAREDLEWRGVDFIEYDVEEDQEARAADAGAHRR